MCTLQRKTNLTEIGPGLRRSVSDGDLTLDEVILKPRKRRSHLFVQSSLDEALTGVGESSTPAMPLKSQASQLLPKELLPVMEGVVTVSLHGRQQ